MAAADERKSPSRRRLAALFLFSLGVYWLNGRDLSQADCIPASYWAWSALTRGSFDLRAYPQLGKQVGMAIVQLPDGSWISRYPPRSALVAITILAPLALGLTLGLAIFTRPTTALFLLAGAAPPVIALLTYNHWIAGALAIVLLYAKWHAWSGGSSYGPRYPIETLPVFCLLFAFGVTSLRTRIAHRAATLLVGISIVIQFLGIFGATPNWDAGGPGDERASRYFALTDTQIEAHARAVVRRVVGSPAPVEESRP